MAAGKGKSLQEETECVQQALDLIFAFFDQRKTHQENPPPEVQQAFAVIVPYYNKRICGAITPRRWCYLSGGAKPQDLHQEAWGKFWRCGAGIKMRTVAGVFSWLRKVVLNHILDELRKHLHLEMIEEGEYQKGNSQNNRLAHFLTDFEILGGGTSDEKQYRFDLLCKFFERALPKLNARQREVICLSQAGKSVPEITKLMSFATKNALSNFKRSELVRMLCATDEEIRYRYELFSGLFAQAFCALDARQRQVVRLSASAVYSAAEIASTMRFTSVTKMLAFQRSAFRMIAKALWLILRSELKKAEVEARRRAVIAEWLEWFANRAGVCFAAFLGGVFMPGIW